MTEHLDLPKIIHLAMMEEDHPHLQECSFCKEQYDNAAELQSLMNPHVRSEGPVKLCRGCGRFMPIDENRNLLPHKKFLKDDICTQQDTTGEKS